MPCIKCSNGKWRYGEHGRCQFKTLESCQAAERAVHARENKSMDSGCRCKDCPEPCENCNNKVEKFRIES